MCSCSKDFLLYTVSCIIQVAGLRSQHNCVLAISHWNMLIDHEMYLNRSMLHLLHDWLALWGGNMNQILGCDWLPKQARWSYVACSWLAGVSHKKNFPESHIINPLLTKLVPSRWLGIGQLLFLRVYGPQLRLHSLNTQKKNLANIQPSWPNKFGQWQMSYWKTLTIHVWLWRLQQRIKMKSFNAQTTKIFAMKRFRNVHVSLTFELIYIWYTLHVCVTASRIFK